MRYLDDLTPLNRYLDPKEQEAAIKDEMDTLKPLITAALMEEPEGKYEHRGFRLSIQTRRTWQYSDDLGQMEKQVKAYKKAEEADGTAVIVKEVSYPVVKVIS